MISLMLCSLSLTLSLSLSLSQVGRVTIDGVDVSTIGLNALRSRIAVIPQVRL